MPTGSNDACGQQRQMLNVWKLCISSVESHTVPGRCSAGNRSAEIPTLPMSASVWKSMKRSTPSTFRTTLPGDTSRCTKPLFCRRCIRASACSHHKDGVKCCSPVKSPEQHRLQHRRRVRQFAALTRAHKVTWNSAAVASAASWSVSGKPQNVVTSQGLECLAGDGGRAMSVRTAEDRQKTGTSITCLTYIVKQHLRRRPERARQHIEAEGCVVNQRERAAAGPVSRLWELPFLNELDQPHLKHDCFNQSMIASRHRFRLMMQGVMSLQQVPLCRRSPRLTRCAALAAAPTATQSGDVTAFRKHRTGNACACCRVG